MLVYVRMNVLGIEMEVWNIFGDKFYFDWGFYGAGFKVFEL